MDPFVLDASVAISWCFPNDPAEDTQYSRRILTLLETRDAIVPEIWGYEMANALYVSCSLRSRITGQQVQEFLERLKALPIRMERQDHWETVALESHARKWGVAAYDAAYLALALHRTLPLATSDQGLRNAAASAGVQLI